MSAPKITPAQALATINLRGHLATAQCSLGQVQRYTSALAAIEQLLRVPVPEDSEADNGSMPHVWRADLAELLGVVCAALQEQTDYTAELVDTSLAQAREAQP